MTLNQRFGYLFGAVYVLVGLVGFAVTGGVGFAGSVGKDLLLFEVNPLHNLVHLAVGGLLIAGAAAGGGASRAINGVVGGTYLLVGLIGLMMVGEASNILALNHPDNLLHLATAGLALGVALRRAPKVAHPAR